MKRREALKLGEKFYNTGKLCKYGHRADRYTRYGTCKACNKNAAVARRRDKIEEVRAYQKEYQDEYIKTAQGQENRKRASDKWDEEHREENRARYKKWYQANKEVAKERAIARYHRIKKENKLKELENEED